MYTTRCVLVHDTTLPLPLPFPPPPSPLPPALSPHPHPHTPSSLPQPLPLPRTLPVCSRGEVGQESSGKRPRIGVPVKGCRVDSLRDSAPSRVVQRPIRSAHGRASTDTDTDTHAHADTATIRSYRHKCSERCRHDIDTRSHVRI